MNQNKFNFFPVVLFLLIIAAGVLSRFWMVDEPNFKPIGALVLFAGFYFGRASIGLGALVAMMLISDLFLGFYQPMMMLAVYGSLMVCCALGVVCHRWKEGRFSASKVGKFAVASLAMSITFFVLTNLAVWSTGMWYPSTLDGLQRCFVAALPFFRNTLASDLLFSQGLLLAYLAVAELSHARSIRLATVAAE